MYFYMVTNFYQNFQKGKDSVKEYEYVHSSFWIYANYFPEESLKQWIPLQFYQKWVLSVKNILNWHLKLINISNNRIIVEIVYHRQIS